MILSLFPLSSRCAQEDLRPLLLLQAFGDSKALYRVVVFG